MLKPRSGPMKAIQDIAVTLQEEDNVAVLKSPLKAGSEVSFDGTTAISNRLIPAGHKIALQAIDPGAPLIKYGQTIGFAQTAIARGDHVHTHNVSAKDFDRDCRFCVDYQPTIGAAEFERKSFPGFLGADGRVGTRNYVAVISSVNCSASVSKYVAEQFRHPDFGRDYLRVDGVIAFTHKSGCSLLPTEPLDLLQRVLAGMANHPNIGGYVLIGLGCEVNQIPQLIRNQKLTAEHIPDNQPAYLNIQSQGGVRKSTEAGVKAVTEILQKASERRRTPQPAAKLVLALNCGGSDGNSGITANPALGHASDRLVRQGGTSVLAETTEIYGAEHLLTRRAASPAVGQKLLDRIRWWQNHVKLHGASIDNNPSHGNREGGLTTIYEKSLGAIAKSGQSSLNEVYGYAEQIQAKGLCFMDTPGNDPVSMTGLVSGGCTIGAFTTGRGSVYGCKPAPCIKIASNTPMFRWLEDDMDLNAGTILDGSETVTEAGERIFEKILSVAGGEKTKSELAGLGDEEFAPWQLGPVL